MPPLHPMIVHFPIALFVVAVLFDGLTLFTRKNSLVEATRLLMVLSTVGTIAAIASGEVLRSHRGSFLPHGQLMLHQALGIAFGIYAIFLCILRVRSTWKPTGGYVTLAALGVVLLAAVGHTGGKMAWPSLPAVSASKSTVGLDAGGGRFGRGSRTGSAAKTGNTAGTGSTHGSRTSPPPSHASSNISTTKPSAPKSSTHPSPSSATQTASQSTTGPILLQYGDNSSVVTSLQEALHVAGAFNHSYTTYYGSVTEGAVKTFQAQHGLAVTGSVNQQTLNRLQQIAGMKVDVSSGASGASPGHSSPSSRQSSSSSGSSSRKSSGNSSSPPSASPQPSQPSVDQVRIQAGYTAFVNSCQACHSLATATQYEGVYSASDWGNVVARMQSYAGGNIADTQDIIYYLSHNGGH